MDSSHAAIAFSALSQETRVSLLRLLAGAGAIGMPAGEIQARLSVPASTLSFHLSVLENAGLVQSTRRGRQMIYAVRINGLRELVAVLTETCCARNPDLCFDLEKLFPICIPEEAGMKPSFNVLFLCTHNSARSIAAEALLNKIGRGSFRAYSAGSEPADAPNPAVIEKLKGLGHDVSRLRSKSWDEFARPDAPKMDFVIALCDTVQGQQCPEFGNTAVTASWPLPDPSHYRGSEVERGILLNQLIAMLSRRLEIFCNLPFESLDRISLETRLEKIGESSPANA
ncbi:MAG: metalloregulator ArsR/SmtB family transcription factor [Alphaproteobacteria bacterium]